MSVAKIALQAAAATTTTTITYLRSGERRPNRVDNENTDERDTDSIVVYVLGN